MNKKLLFLALAIILLAGCSGRQKKEDEVSEGAQKVIEAMMTCPNRDLFNLDAATVIGEGVVTTEEEKEKIKAAYETLHRNWEEAVGEYFGYGYLESFINNGVAVQYLAESEIENSTISVIQMSLDERKNGVEKITVTISVDGVEKQMKVTIKYDMKGLIKTVEVS